jgi:hypothetical protein
MPDPSPPEPEAQEGERPPPHRVAGRAALQVLVGAPIMALTVVLAWAVVEDPSGDEVGWLALVFLSMSAAFLGLLGVVAGVARRVTLGLRPFAVLGGGLGSALAAGLGIAWALGLAQGGPEQAFHDVQDLLVKILADFDGEVLAIGLASASIFLAVGLVEARAVGPLRRFDRRWFAYLVAGVVGGVVGTALWVADRVDGRVVAWLRARLEEAD